MATSRKSGGGKRASKKKPSARQKAKKSVAQKPETTEEIDTEAELRQLQAKVEAQREADKKAKEAEDKRIEALKAEEEKDQRSKIQQAREARRARREALQKELENPPVVAASVHSIEDAKAKREVIEAEIKKIQPQTVELSELDSYRLLHLSDVKRNAEQAVRDPLIKKVQADLDADIEVLKKKAHAKLRTLLVEGLKTDDSYMEATRKHAEAVNAVIELLTPDLPEGYAITLLEPEKQEATATYAPDQRGKLLKIPE